MMLHVIKLELLLLQLLRFLVCQYSQVTASIGPSNVTRGWIASLTPEAERICVYATRIGVSYTRTDTTSTVDTQNTDKNSTDEARTRNRSLLERMLRNVNIDVKNICECQFFRSNVSVSAPTAPILVIKSSFSRGSTARIESYRSMENELRPISRSRVMAR